MTDWYILLELLRQNPDEDALACMLTDALVESGDYDHTSASDLVAQERAVARTAATLDRAVRLLQDDLDSAVWLRSIIRRCAPRLFVPGTMIVVVSGDSEPFSPTPSRVRRGVRTPPRAVLVGAGWVIARWEDHLSYLDSRDRRDRRRLGLG